MEDNNLFSSTPVSSEPLAARMRPRTLDEYIGQDHILGKGRLLQRKIAEDGMTLAVAERILQKPDFMSCQDSIFRDIS